MSYQHEGKTYTLHPSNFGGLSCKGCAFDAVSCGAIPFASACCDKPWSIFKEVVPEPTTVVETSPSERYGSVTVQQPQHYVRPVAAATEQAINNALGLSRKTDPATSQAAAEVCRPLSLQQVILYWLTLAEVAPPGEQGGLTGKEIASRSERPLNSITPRFAQLVKAGKIKDSGLRRDKQIVWRLT